MSERIRDTVDFDIVQPVYNEVKFWEDALIACPSFKRFGFILRYNSTDDYLYRHQTERIIVCDDDALWVDTNYAISRIFHSRIVPELAEYMKQKHVHPHIQSNIGVMARGPLSRKRIMERLYHAILHVCEPIRLDDNWRLVPFKDKVVVHETDGSITVRERKLDDYISIRCGLKFGEQCTDDAGGVDMEKFKMFRKTDIDKYAREMLIEAAANASTNHARATSKTSTTATTSTQADPTTTQPPELRDCIRIVSETWLTNPEHFSESDRQQMRELHRLQFCPVGDAPTVVNLGKSDEGREVVDGWESNAVTLHQLYVAHHDSNPSELSIQSIDAAPVSVTTPHRHLIRFHNLCSHAGPTQRMSTGDIRKFLCTTDEGRTDLKAAGLRAVSAAGRVGATSVTHWIVDEAQLQRLMRRHRAHSTDELPTDLLNHIQYEVDHLEPKQYHGKREILTDADVLVNYALVPKWLNQKQQWKDGYGSAKIAYVGVIGHQLFRLFKIALSAGTTTPTLRAMHHLFVHADTCIRSDVHRDVWKAIGTKRKWPGASNQSLVAISGFASNVEVTASSQRRIQSFFKRRRVEVASDMAPNDEVVNEVDSDEEDLPVVASLQEVQSSASSSHPLGDGPSSSSHTLSPRASRGAHPTPQYVKGAFEILPGTENTAAEVSRCLMCREGQPGYTSKDTPPYNQTGPKKDNRRSSSRQKHQDAYCNHPKSNNMTKKRQRMSRRMNVRWDMTPEKALVYMKSKGIVAQNVSFRLDMANGFHEDETTGALSWFEPIPAASTEPSYGIQYTEIPSDHLETLYEVVERDGVTWHLARAITSQPYHTLHFETDKLGSMGLKVHRLDDKLSWYQGAPTAVYVYQPVHAVPFDMFRKTFRYWLITRVGPQRSFPADFLPAVLTPPHPNFFDIIDCCDIRSVKLGIKESLEPAWAVLHTYGWIEFTTFEFIWNAYRSFRDT